MSGASAPTRSAIAALVHDLGKRIARTARNVEGAPLPDFVLAMVLKDLYVVDGTRRASEVFAMHAGALDGPLARAREAIAVHLARLDVLEPGVRAGDAAAVDEALALAREVEHLVRGLAMEVVS